jgi:hypothetical protein|tara:strand:- start:744 stop:968 length:225 start_codon:yes stop_codon:yes gene_type:complete
MKHIVAKRVPPGDRWSIEGDEVVYPSLTDCLNAIYLLNSSTRFDIDAKSGEIFTDDGVVKPEPIKKYSLYGEEM